jgi:predicted nucleic acid-binding protein
MNYLLDTCIISELIKPMPNPKVVNWVRDCSEETLFLSVLTIGEIQKGIAKLPESEKREILQFWFEHDLPRRFEGRIIDITPQVARKWGEIQGKAEQEGKKMPAIDGLIAATGLVYNLTVVTRNTSDVEVSGVQTFNPWKELADQEEQ